MVNFNKNFIKYKSLNKWKNLYLNKNKILKDKNRNLKLLSKHRKQSKFKNGERK